jgi:hypothetical protein
MNGKTGFGISSRTIQTGVEVDYNLVWNWPAGNYNNVISGTHHVIADPLFVDWANGNLYLLPASPAVDHGSNGSAAAAVPADDRDGVSRPLDGDDDGTAAVDIGAYEYLPGMAVFTVTTSAGSWASPDGRLSVAWEAGAVSASVVITYTPRGLLYPAYPLEFWGVGFSLSPDSAVNFTSPLILTIHYDDLLPANADESAAKLYFWNDGQYAWQALAVLDRDPAANTITVQLTHLSDFALLGPQTASQRIYLPLVIR